VAPETKLKECVILGCGPTCVEIPWDRVMKDDIQVFGVNGVYTFTGDKNRRLDKLFMTDTEDEVNRCWYDVARLVKMDTTLVLPAPYQRFVDLGLKIEIYPIQEIVERFQTNFFSNSIAYMQAYALLHDYDVIYFYGIDMMTHSTYVQEKGGVEYWMGITDGIRAERIRSGGKPYPLTINTKGSATGKSWNGKMYGYYGEQSDQKAKEGLFAPWEFVKVAKTGETPDWVMVNGEYKKLERKLVADGDPASVY
jgi:hypothetical protein